MFNIWPGLDTSDTITRIREESRSRNEENRKRLLAYMDKFEVCNLSIDTYANKQIQMTCPNKQVTFKMSWLPYFCPVCGGKTPHTQLVQNLKNKEKKV